MNIQKKYYFWQDVQDLDREIDTKDLFEPLPRMIWHKIELMLVEGHSRIETQKCLSLGVSGRNISFAKQVVPWSGKNTHI